MATVNELPEQTPKADCGTCGGRSIVVDDEATKARGRAVYVDCPECCPVAALEALPAEVVERTARDNLVEIVDAGEQLVEEIGAKLAGDGKLLRKKAHEMEREGRKAGGVIFDLLFTPGTATKLAEEARQKIRGGR